MTTRITSEQLRGIFPALATPVTADGQIDTQAVRALLDHLQGSGISGTVPPMTIRTSEATPADRKDQS